MSLNFDTPPAPQVSDEQLAQPPMRIPFSPWLLWSIILGLLLLLRLVGAESRGIWQDEGLTLYQVRLPFSEIVANRIPVAQFITQNTVPPLFFLLLSAWGKLLGYSLWALRLFSIFAALLVSVILFRVGDWMDGRRTGFLAALLAGISPLYLWYAQELRMYAFLLVPAALSFGLLWRGYRSWMRGQTPWRWAVAYALTAGAMVWTHFLAFLLVGAQLVWLGAVLLRRRPRLLLAIGGGLALVASPLLPVVIPRFLAGADRDFYFKPLDAIVIDALHSFAFGLPRFLSTPEEAQWLLPVAVALLGLGLWQAWRRGGWPLALLLGGGLVLPVLALYLASYVKPLYQNARHLLVISPAFYLLWALGLARLGEIRRWLPIPVVALLALGWVPATNRYFFPAEPLKNDVRPLFEYLAARYVPGDVVALNDPVLQHAFQYFAPDIPWTVLPLYTWPVESAEVETTYQETVQKYRRVWYVYGPPDTTFETWEHPLEWFNDHFQRISYVEFPGQTIVAAAYFDTQGPVIQESPFPSALPGEQRFAGTIRFEGLREPLGTTEAGRRTVIETLWTVTAQPTEDFQMALRLVDGRGRHWHQAQINPFDGLHTTSRWLPGQYVRLPLFFEPPATLAPGTYTLELLLVGPEGRQLFPDGATAPLPLGPLTLTAAKAPPPGEGIAVGDGLLVAVEPLPQTLPPAPTVNLALHLAVTGDGPRPDAFRLRIAGADGTERWTETLAVRDGLPQTADGSPFAPPEAWEPGQQIGLRYEISLPPSLEGDQTVSLVALDDEQPLPAGGLLGLWRDEALFTQTVHVTARERRLERPSIDQAVDAEWPGAVRLVGYTASPMPATREAPFRWQLVWQPLGATERPYKVFLQLVDANGAFVTGADAFFEVPSTAWVADEYLLSEHEFDLSMVPPGRYTVLAGLYHEASQERLPVEAPNNAVSIGTIELP